MKICRKNRKSANFIESTKILPISQNQKEENQKINYMSELHKKCILKKIRKIYLKK
jgi:hypothetical protein